MPHSLVLKICSHAGSGPTAKDCAMRPQRPDHGLYATTQIELNSRSQLAWPQQLVQLLVPYNRCLRFSRVRRFHAVLRKRKSPAWGERMAVVPFASQAVHRGDLNNRRWLREETGFGMEQQLLLTRCCDQNIFHHGSEPPEALILKLAAQPAPWTRVINATQSSLRDLSYVNDSGGLRNASEFKYSSSHFVYVCQKQENAVTHRIVSDGILQRQSMLDQSAEYL